MSLQIVILGLSITSSWGNGHASTYRALVRELDRRGHDVVFLERDRPWYAESRDLPEPPYGRTCLYGSLPELYDCFGGLVRRADAVILGSYVPDGVAVGRWVTSRAAHVTAFYDIDTPVTMAKLAAGDHEYIAPDLLPRFDIYLSFTGGPILRRVERAFGAQRAMPLYCSVDPEVHYPDPQASAPRWSLGYLGTYSPDRQPKLERLLLAPARRLPSHRFAVAGSQYPDIDWPANVAHIDHVSPDRHRAFYCAQRFTLNITRDDMIAAGWSPSVRLFEAAACGVPIVSDWWPGLDRLFTPDKDILIARSTAEVSGILRDMSAKRRRALAASARRRVMAEHTAARRAEQMEQILVSLRTDRRRVTPPPLRGRRAVSEVSQP